MFHARAMRNVDGIFDGDFHALILRIACDDRHIIRLGVDFDRHAVEV